MQISNELIPKEQIYRIMLELSFAKQIRTRWKDGRLVKEWSEQFPELFDSQDVSYANVPVPGYKFYEWYSAISVYKRFGYLSLLEGYDFKVKIDARKKDLIERILPAEVLKVLPRGYGGKWTQAPDLLCYLPDYSDWFFCEVKGPGDKLSIDQNIRFERLFKAAQKRIRLILLEER